MLLFLSSSQEIKGKIQIFDISLRLYRFYGAICAVKIRELLRNILY